MSTLSKPRKALPIAVLLIIVIHVCAVAVLDMENSPNIDECAHLVSGLHHWEFGQYDLYRVNPPLIRSLASLSCYLCGIRSDWQHADTHSLAARSEFLVGRDFLKKNGRRLFTAVSIGRLLLLPISCFGCFIIYSWGRKHYGHDAGVMTLVLYASSPDVLTWSASITPDMGSAIAAMATIWVSGRWMQKADTTDAIGLGIAIGISILAKSTLILLVPFFILVSTLSDFAIVRRKFGMPIIPLRRRAAGIVLLTLVALFILNLGYSFEGSLTRLGDFEFTSSALRGDFPADGESGNRFVGTVFEDIPIPLPKNFLRGLDVQKHDFERKKYSYLFGVQRLGGWYHYYAVAWLAKSTIASIIAAFFASLSLLHSKREVAFEEWVMMLFAGAYFILISSEIGFSKHYRYALPSCVAILFLSSRFFALSAESFAKRACIYALLFASIAETAVNYPSVHSYMNLLAGGARSKEKWLLDSSADWGQDLLRLKAWTDRNAKCQPLYLAYFGGRLNPPEYIGIVSVPVPKRQRDGSAPQLQPGWYALSVNLVHGLICSDSNGSDYTYFQRLQPTEFIGGTIYLYHITENQDAD